MGKGSGLEEPLKKTRIAKQKGEAYALVSAALDFYAMNALDTMSEIAQLKE